MDDLLPTLADSISNSSSIAAPIVGELLDEVDLEQCRLLGPFALIIQVRLLSVFSRKDVKGGTL
jgi:hypothetical protein